VKRTALLLFVTLLSVVASTAHCRRGWRGKVIGKGQIVELKDHVVYGSYTIFEFYSDG